MVKWMMYKTNDGLPISQQDLEMYIDVELVIEQMKFSSSFRIGKLKATNINEYLYCVEYGMEPIK